MSNWYAVGTPLKDGAVAYAADVNAHLTAIETAFSKLPDPDKIAKAVELWLDDVSTTANSIVGTVAWPAGAGVSNYHNGMLLVVRPANDNLGPTTITVGSLPTVPIRRPDGTELEGGEIRAGQPVLLVYTDGSFRLLGSWEAGGWGGTDPRIPDPSTAPGKWLRAGTDGTYMLADLWDPDFEANVALPSYFPFLLSVPHGLGARPRLYRVWYRCLVNELGYIAGDEVDVGHDIYTNGYHGNVVVERSSGILVMQRSHPALRRLTDGEPNLLTLSSWEYVVRVWK